MDAFEKVQNLLTQAKALHKEGMRPGKAILKACFLGGFKIPSQGCVKDLSVFLTEDFTLVRGEWENSYKEVKSCMTYMYEEIKDIYHKELPMVDIWSLRGEDGVKARVLVNTEGLMYAKTYGEAHYVLTAVVTVAGLGRTNNWLGYAIPTVRVSERQTFRPWYSPMASPHRNTIKKISKRLDELEEKLDERFCQAEHLERLELANKLSKLIELADSEPPPVFTAHLVVKTICTSYDFLENMDGVQVDGYLTEEMTNMEEVYQGAQTLYAEFLMKELKLPKFDPEKEELRVKSIEASKAKVEAQFYNSFNKRARASKRARRNRA